VSKYFRKKVTKVIGKTMETKCVQGTAAGVANAYLTFPYSVDISYNVANAIARGYGANQRTGDEIYVLGIYWTFHIKYVTAYSGTYDPRIRVVIGTKVHK